MLETYEYGDVQASAKPITNLSVDVKSAILIEQSTGAVLYEKDADEKMPMASITKVMSLILIMEHIDSGADKCQRNGNTGTIPNSIECGLTGCAGT